MLQSVGSFELLEPLKHIEPLEHLEPLESSHIMEPMEPLFDPNDYKATHEFNLYNEITENLKNLYEKIVIEADHWLISDVYQPRITVEKITCIIVEIGIMRNFFARKFTVKVGYDLVNNLCMMRHFCTNVFPNIKELAKGAFRNRRARGVVAPEGSPRDRYDSFMLLLIGANMKMLELGYVITHNSMN
jgi:hypothetical protein